jgi:hypothetical protein
MKYDDSAVSETLGYIILFGIALTAIALILLVGNTIIDNEKSRDNFQNIVQSFNIIQSNMKQVALDGTPVKTTTIHMEGGTMGKNTTAARLQVDYNGLQYDSPTGQIIFIKDRDTTYNVSIENGGVWEAMSGYSTMVAQPRIYVTPLTGTLVLNVYKLSAAGTSIANSGAGTMTIEMRYNNSSNVLPTVVNPAGAVTLTMDTNYRNAWKDYLNNSMIGTNVAVTYDDSYPDGVKATLSPISQLIISEHCINVSMSGLYA